MGIDVEGGLRAVWAVWTISACLDRGSSWAQPAVPSQTRADAQRGHRRFITRLHVRPDASDKTRQVSPILIFGTVGLVARFFLKTHQEGSLVQSNSFRSGNTSSRGILLRSPNT